METFGLYSLKAGIILALFGMIYHICLQKETFYRFNRFFLLLGMGIALLLPLYSVHYIVEVGTDPSAFLIEGFDYPEAVTTGTNEESTLLQLCYRFLPVIYITGISVLLIFRLFGFLHLFFAIRKNETKQFTNYNLIESSDFEGAFSFFRYIFISGQLQEYEKRIILKHEETHVRQKHWIDLVFINLLNLLWWFNPVIWLYEKAIRNNHEYLADQAVLTDHKQTEYQKTLVNQWFKIPVFPITNSFSYSNKLKRIHMMKKNTSNPVKQLFALIAIPVLALFLWAFAEPEYIQTNKNTFEPAIQKDSVIYAFVSQENLEAIQNESESTLQLQQPIVIKEGEKQPLILIDGQKSETSIENIDPAQIHSVSVFKDESALEKYGEEGKNGVIEIVTKKAINATDDKSQNRPVGGPIPPNESNLMNISVDEHQSISIDSKKNTEEVNTIDPVDAASLSVVEDEKKTIRYGEDLKFGTTTITTVRVKNDLLDKYGIVIEGVTTDENNNPIANAIASVIGTGRATVTDKNGKFTLKVIPDEQIHIFADGYKVEAIIHENNNKQKYVIQLKQDDKVTETKKPESITNSLESGKETENFIELENRLVVINGEPTDKSFSKLDINPDDIAYISVLKDKSAMQLYGEKAINGVVLITTK